MKQLNRLLPSFDNEDRTLRARLLTLVLFTFVLVALGIGISSFFLHDDPMPLVISTVGLLFISGVLLFMTYRGATYAASITFVVVLWGFFTMIGALNGGIDGSGPINYISVVTVAGLLLGLWPGVGVALVSGLATLAMVLAAANGVLPEVALPSTPGSKLLTLGANLLLSAFFLGYSFRGTRAALRRARDSESALIESHNQLQVVQEQLLHSQKLEAVGQLAGGVAHDFNNLLTAIGGYASLLGMALPDEEAGRKELREIRVATERGAELTQQLLAFGRRQVLQPRIINLNDVVSAVDHMLRRLIGENIELETRLAADVDAVSADPGQMEQIVVNLAINARDAMPQSGRLTIETANALLDAEYARSHADVTPGNYVQLSVSDTGRGMPREIQERIYEPYFTTKEQDGGSGLGLSTVYGIVKQSNGLIAVYSEPDEGTTFKVYFPRVDGVAKPLRPPVPAAAADGGSETLLVVEDEPSLLSLVRDVMERLGYRVLVAARADEALELSRNYGSTIDLLLSDVIMPGGMSGPDLARVLTKERPQIRVLYTSGYTENAIVHHGVLDPGVNFLQKPFTPEIIGQRVRDILDEPQG